MPEKVSSEGLIPVQLGTLSEKKLSAMFEGSRISFTDEIPLNIFIGFAIQLVWMKLEDISFLTINSLISVSISGVP